MPLIRSNLCTRHILNKITPRRHEDWPDKRRSVDQRFELTSITIPKWVRVLDGVIDPSGGSRENFLGARNGISQIAEIWNKTNWLPTLDPFRTFAE